jgi:hypothetical protein
MTEQDAWTMTAGDRAALLDLLLRADAHQGPFGETVTTNADGTLCLPWSRHAAIVDEVVRFVVEKDLLAVGFEWTAWEAGRQAVQRGDRAALANFTAQECSQYLTLLVRADRFNEGMLVGAFENGQMQTLLRQMCQYAEPLPEGG